MRTSITIYKAYTDDVLLVSDMQVVPRKNWQNMFAKILLRRHDLKGEEGSALELAQEFWLY